ncbi:MAG: hypothetical protein ACLPIC_13065 [Rhodoblastus sp.]|uniref:hypothetical protein n=1 Tax=Rhodoblastus sp. TaxID=1962975 RepID=UPI003F9C6B0A
MRKLAWPILTLVLMAVSFVVGRKTGAFHNLPAIAATLPGAEADFSRELDARIRDRFPIGTNEETLIAYLAGEGFLPEWRRRDEPNTSAFIRNGLLCTDIVRVLWRADATGILREVSGSYASQCI